MFTTYSHKPEIRGALPNRKEIYHYLAAEVLSHMPGDLTDFMISTSVLDIMTPEICDHFLERNDSEQVLENLESRNLFVKSEFPQSVHIAVFTRCYPLFVFHSFKDHLGSLSVIFSPLSLIFRELTTSLPEF